MATKPVVCPDCGALVPYGRLACSQCGALIASVAGSPIRSLVRADDEPAESLVEAETEAEPDEPSEPERHLRPSRIVRRPISREIEAEALADAAPLELATDVTNDSRPDPDTLLDVTGAAAPAAAERLAARSIEDVMPEATAAEPGAVEGPEPAVVDSDPAGAVSSAGPAEGGPVVPELSGVPQAAESRDTAVDVESQGSADAGAQPPGVRPTDPAGTADIPSILRPAAPDSPSVFEPVPGDIPSVLRPVPARPALPPVPGSYLPPNEHLDRYAWPSTGPSPAAAGAPASWPASPASPGSAAGAGTPGMSVGEEPAGAGEIPRVGRWADVPPEPSPGPVAGTGPAALDVPTDLAGWLLAIGAFLSAAAYLLPWASTGIGVIGASQIGSGYLDSWGLANPANLILVLLAAFALALVLVPSRVPVWIREGAGPILLGGLDMGVWFTYVASPFGDGIGILVVLVAGILLVAGGVLALRPGRHVPGRRGV